MSSRTDARSLLVVRAALESRGITTLACCGAGPELDGIAALARDAGVPLRVIGDDLPINADALLAAVRPRVVVMGADSLYLTQRVIASASRAGVATVLVQEAANEYTPDARVRKSLRTAMLDMSRARFRARLMLAHADWRGLLRLATDTLLARRRVVPGYGFASVDLFCVADESVAHSYRSRGSRAARIVATGIPHLIPALPAGIQPDHDFLVLTQPFELSGFMAPGRARDLYIDMVQSLRRAVPGCRVLGKLHPVESPAAYDGVGFDAIESDLATAVARARVSVSVHSAALAVAMAHDRAACAFIPDWLSEGADNMIVQMLGDRGMVARDAAAFERIASAAHRENHAATHRAFPLCTDGLATQRIADAIVSLMDRDARRPGV